MSKFSKTVLKNIQNANNCVVLGQAFGYLNDLCETFDTVFILTEEKKYRKRNLIYRHNFEDTTYLPPIQLTVIDAVNIERMHEIEKILNQYQPATFIEHVSFLNKDQTKFLNRLGLYYTELHKDAFQIWKRKT